MLLFEPFLKAWQKLPNSLSEVMLGASFSLLATNVSNVVPIQRNC